MMVVGPQVQKKFFFVTDIGMQGDSKNNNIDVHWVQISEVQINYFFCK